MSIVNLTSELMIRSEMRLIISTYFNRISLNSKNKFKIKSLICRPNREDPNISMMSLEHIATARSLPSIKSLNI